MAKAMSMAAKRSLLLGFLPERLYWRLRNAQPTVVQTIPPSCMPMQRSGSQLKMRNISFAVVAYEFFQQDRLLFHFDS